MNNTTIADVVIQPEHVVDTFVMLGQVDRFVKHILFYMAENDDEEIKISFDRKSILELSAVLVQLANLAKHNAAS